MAQGTQIGGTPLLDTSHPDAVPKSRYIESGLARWPEYVRPTEWRSCTLCVGWVFELKNHRSKSHRCSLTTPRVPSPRSSGA